MLKKIGKKIGSAFKKVGKKLKKGLKKVAGKFAELGPLGSIALSFVVPTIGQWFQGLPDGGFLKTVADGVSNTVGAVKNGVGKVFNRITDAVETGLNGIAAPFTKAGMNERGFGSALRDGISNLTGGFIEGSDKSYVVDGTTIDVKNAKGSRKAGGLTKDERAINRSNAKLEANKLKVAKDDSLNNIMQGTDEGKTLLESGDLSRKQMRDLKKVGKLEKAQAGDGYSFTNYKEQSYTKPTKLKIDSRKWNKEVEQKWYHSGKGSTGYNPSLDTGGPAFLDSSTHGIMEPSGSANWREHVRDSKEFTVAKKVVPAQVATSAYFQQEEAQEAAVKYAKQAQSKYFSNVAQNVLQRPVEPNVSYLDFNTNLTQEQMFLLQNSYNGIISGGERSYG